MFYFLFESRNEKINDSEDPVVLWMTGGPGCSSELAVFYENGPYSINKNMTLTETQWGWDKFHTMIFVDQPINTGFSFSESEDDRVYDEDVVGDDMLDFLQEFFAVHPELADRPFYVTGESYAGHYVPAVSHRIWLANKNKEGNRPINLKGIAIGNGLTDPGIQFPAYPDFARENRLISPGLQAVLHFFAPVCTVSVRLCNSGWSLACALGLGLCQMVTFAPIMSVNPTMNVYDITKKCEGQLCYDFSNADKFLNLPSVRTSLGVGDRAWQGCAMDVYEDMSGDWLKDFEGYVADLLNDDIPVMIYAGELDFICNWLGNRRWVEAMKWKGSAAWLASSDEAWMVLGQPAGTVKASGPLSFVKVAKAGHMVPMDQPLNSLAMITAFTRGKPVGSAAPKGERDPEAMMQKVAAADGGADKAAEKKKKTKTQPVVIHGGDADVATGTASVQ